jgi:hypothetical protein
VVPAVALAIGAHIGELRPRPLSRTTVGLPGAAAGQVQPMTADVVQRAGHGQAVVALAADVLDESADRRHRQGGEHGVDQPPGASGHGGARAARGPRHQHEHGRWPHPARNPEAVVVGGECDQGHSADAEEGGGDVGPSLRRVGDAGGQRGEQRPARGEGEQRDAGGDVLDSAGDDAEHQDGRSECASGEGRDHDAGEGSASARVGMGGRAAARTWGAEVGRGHGGAASW